MQPDHSLQPRKQPRQPRSQVTVNAILDATAHILVTDGYGGLNTNRVAEHAGVSIGSLYQYFPNKAALVTAVRRRHAEQMREQLRLCAARVAGQPLPQAVADLVNAVMLAHRIDPVLHAVLEQEVPRTERFGGRADLNTDLRGLVKSVLTQYRKDIQCTNLDLTSFVLVRTVDALVHATLLEDPLDGTAQSLEREIRVLVLRYLGATTA